MDFIAGGVRLVSVALLVTLVVAIAVQVGGRYVFNKGIPYTDEIAQVSLTWLAFISMSWVYRLNQHITVQLPLFDDHSPIARVLDGVTNLLVIVLMAAIIYIAIGMEPMMSRVFPGTMSLSRFQMHLLPLMIGAALTILFALEALIRDLTGSDYARS